MANWFPAPSTSDQGQQKQYVDMSCDLIERANEAVQRSCEIIERTKEIKIRAAQIRAERRGLRNGPRG